MFNKVLFCVLMMTMFLEGCGNTAAPVTQSDASVSPMPSSMPSPPSAVVVGDIGMSQDEIIELIDSHNSENNYATIAQAIKATAEVIAAPEKNYSCTRYTLQDGVAVYFWTDPETLAVRQFTFESDKILRSDSGTQLSEYICASLPVLFEPDGYEQLTSDLMISGTDEVDNAKSEKTTRTYLYSNQEDKESFTVIPTQSNPLTASGITFIDIVKSWTLDSYLDRIKAEMESSNYDISGFDHSDSYDHEPGYNGTAYFIAAGTNTLLLESKDTGEIDEITVLCNLPDADDLSIKTFAFVVYSNILMFDEANYNNINSSLQIGKVGENDRRFASGDDWSYIYTIENQKLWFTAVRQISPRYEGWAFPENTENPTSANG